MTLNHHQQIWVVWFFDTLPRKKNLTLMKPSQSGLPTINSYFSIPVMTGWHLPACAIQHVPAAVCNFPISCSSTRALWAALGSASFKPSWDEVVEAEDQEILVNCGCVHFFHSTAWSLLARACIKWIQASGPLVIRQVRLPRAGFRLAAHMDYPLCQLKIRDKKFTDAVSLNAVPDPF